MEIVINIPEKKYLYVKNLVKNGNENNSLVLAIGNGIPLPENHGDLVDRDAINERFYDIWNELECCSNKPTYKRLLDNWSICMDTAPVIIKAEREDKK